LSGENRPARSVQGVTPSPFAKKSPEQVDQNARNGNRDGRSRLFTSLWRCRRSLPEDAGLGIADAQKFRLDILANGSRHRPTTAFQCMPGVPQHPNHATWTLRQWVFLMPGHIDAHAGSPRTRHRPDSISPTERIMRLESRFREVKIGMNLLAVGQYTHC